MVLNSITIRNVLILIALLYSRPIAVYAEGGVYINRRVVDFGVLPKFNKKVVAVFYVRNISKKKIAVNKANAGCGCTTVKYSPSPLNPGEVSKVYVDVRTLYKRGKFDEGVLIRFTDGKAEVLHVKGIKDYYDKYKPL